MLKVCYFVYEYNCHYEVRPCNILELVYHKDLYHKDF